MRKLLSVCVLLGVVGVANVFAAAMPPIDLHRVFAVAEKPKSSDTAVTPPAAAAKDEIPIGARYLYKLARIRAAGELAKKENISRRAAAEKIDDALTDAQLHELVKSAPTPVTIKAQPIGGKLTDFLEWLAEHKDVIMAIVAIIMSLFQA